MTADDHSPPAEAPPVDAATGGAAGARMGNRLLAGLEADVTTPMLAAAQRVRMRMRQIVIEQGSPIEHIYFPEGAVFSELALMADGGVVETLTVGSEGVVGLPALMGATRSVTQTMCQIGGWALRIPTAALVEAAPRDGVLFDRLLRYAEARMTSLTRSVACNRIHSAQQRYARWVLTTQDRVGTDEFPLTQEFLSQMLGVTRPTISLVSQELQAAGLIHQAQGRLTVDDRPRLERVSCECYATIRRAFEELLGFRTG
jgi:CRP-like cAMP-binding protein